MLGGETQDAGGETPPHVPQIVLDKPRDRPQPLAEQLDDFQQSRRVLRQHRQKIAAIELEYLRVLMSHRRSRARTAVKRRYLAEDIATAKEVQNDLASISRYVADFHAARHDKEQAVGMVSSLEQRGPLRVAPEVTRLH